ncbi:MAG TPA: cardiolipin synthase ClsB [Burkholderiaceae bacterium]|nr:cardiolipin synthase ClsB [Burkholderiaceae bacterium]
MKLEWTAGNRIALLENGEQYYPRVFEAIARARQEVLVETFILFDDEVGRQLHTALLQARANGAEVHVLVDGWGSPDLPPDFIEPLTRAGVQMRAFDPVRRLFGQRINLFRRMHRKLVVTDGQTAFVGGINFSVDHLAESGPKAKQDYAVQIEGPLVAQIRAFCRAALATPQPRRTSWLRRWRAQTGAASGLADPDAGAVAALVTRDNADHRDDIERQYRAALRRARERVIIANAYFFPGYRLLKDLRRAARRGVQVDLILQGAPDMPIVQTAASLLHPHLIRAGVRIHEYCQRPLHGKVATVDDEWATVGSSNLDPTSLGLNLEANVLVRDPAFARLLRERLDALIEEGCSVVKLAPPTRLGSAWIQLRSFFVFHFLRNFPSWIDHLPASEPKVAALQAENP